MAFAVDDVEIFLRIHCELVRQIPLADAFALVGRTTGALSHLFEQLAGLVEHHDAVVAIPVGHDDVAVVENGDA